MKLTRADVIQLPQEALHGHIAIEDVRDLEAFSDVAGTEVDEVLAPLDRDLGRCGVVSAVDDEFNVQVIASR